jgi:hypothetical protein
MKEDNQTKPPPYLSFTTFMNFLASLKNGVIPARIDKTLMVGQSGATQSYLMSSLRFFDLIDANGAPRPELETLVMSQGDERKKIWKPIFEKGYEAIIGDLNLETSTVGMLHEKFSAQGLAGQTVKKCHSFFAAAAKEAGIPLAPQLEPNTRGSGTGGRRRKKASPPAKPGANEPDEFVDENGSAGGGQKDTIFSTLFLDSKGERQVKVKAPTSVTNAELERIKNWLTFQLIVSGGEG